MLEPFPNQLLAQTSSGKARLRSLVTSMKSVAVACASGATSLKAGLWGEPFFEGPAYTALLQQQQGRNASGGADYALTAHGLTLLHRLIAPVAKDLGAVLKITAEEANHKYQVDFLAKYVGGAVADCLLTGAEFYRSLKEDVLGFSADFLDGSLGFRNSSMDWATVLTAFWAGIPRITVFYNPDEDLLVEAVMPGDPGRVWEGAWATLSHLRSGITEDLVARFNSLNGRTLQRVPICLHKSRTVSDEFGAAVEGLSAECEAGYALNCGSSALVRLLRASVGGFASNSVPRYDLCSFAVCMTAVSQGRLTLSDLFGNEILWNSDERLGVVAGPEQVRAEMVRKIQAHVAGVKSRISE
jgi:hypothetical protein